MCETYEQIGVLSQQLQIAINTNKIVLDKQSLTAEIDKFFFLLFFSHNTPF